MAQDVHRLVVVSKVGLGIFLVALVALSVFLGWASSMACALDVCADDHGWRGQLGAWQRDAIWWIANIGGVLALVGIPVMLWRRPPTGVRIAAGTLVAVGVLAWWIFAAVA